MREETISALEEYGQIFQADIAEMENLPVNKHVPNILYGKKLFQVKDGKLQAFIPVESVYTRHGWQTLLQTPFGYELRDTDYIFYFESVEEYYNSDQYKRILEEGPLVINYLPEI